MDRRHITIRNFPIRLKRQVKVLAAEKGIRITQMFERVIKAGLEAMKDKKEG